MSRKTDLEQHTRESYSLIRQYEDMLRLSADPKEQARSRRGIEEQWELIKSYLAEYVPLCERLSLTVPADIAEISVTAGISLHSTPLDEFAPTPSRIGLTGSLTEADTFTSYETGLIRLLKRLGSDHPRYADALVYQQRLLENIAQSRRYGDTEARRAERAQIVDALNWLALDAVAMSFNELCSGAHVESQKPLPPTRPKSSRLVEYDTPGGTLSPGSKVYVERGIDSIFKKKILQPGNIVVIRGNVEMGKSSLLASGLAYAQKEGWQTIQIDFQGKRGVTDSDNADDLLRSIATSICLNMDKRLRLNPELVMKIWDTLGAQYKLLDFVKDYVLTRFDESLVLAMDEVNRILNTPLGNDFQGLLKTWQHNIATNKKVWDKLTIVTVFSTEPYLLADDITPLQWTIGTKIEVRGFNQEEMQYLNQQYGNPLSQEELQDMAQLLGGHPYLTHIALHEIVSGEPNSWQELAELAIDDEYSPFKDHLIRRCTLVRKRPELEAALRQIAQEHTCSDREAFLRLQAAGLVRRKGQEYHCRYKLYERYFESHL